MTDVGFYSPALICIRIKQLAADDAVLDPAGLSEFTQQLKAAVLAESGPTSSAQLLSGKKSEVVARSVAKRVAYQLIGVTSQAPNSRR